MLGRGLGDPPEVRRGLGAHPTVCPGQRNGADFSVYVNTAQEFDGSDSGARPDEAVSWGKIRVDATPVKVGGLRGLGEGDLGTPKVGFSPLTPLLWARFTPTPRSCSRCSWPRRSPGAPTPSGFLWGPPRHEGPPSGTPEAWGPLGGTPKA